MDLLMENGDIKTDSRGIPVRISGTEELIRRAMIRLTVRKGSFAPQKELGSDLHKLKGKSHGEMEQAAMAYVQEALYPLKQISVKGLKGRYDRENDKYTLEVELSVQGQGRRLEIEV